MAGLGRVTYSLGWICLVLAVLGRVALQTALADPMVRFGVMPRNFIQLSFLFFIISIASHFCGENTKA